MFSIFTLLGLIAFHLHLSDPIHIVQRLRRASLAVVQNLLRQSQSQRMRSRSQSRGPCWSWSASEVSFIFWDVALRKDSRKINSLGFLKRGKYFWVLWYFISLLFLFSCFFFSSSLPGLILCECFVSPVL